MLPINILKTTEEILNIMIVILFISHYLTKMNFLNNESSVDCSLTPDNTEW